MFLPSNITLEPGDSGDYVTELQRRLAQRDLLTEGNINGIYDGITTQAVKGFQSLCGLAIDGIAGPETLRRLATFGASSSGDSGGAADDSATQEDEQAKWKTEQERQFLLAQQLTEAYNQTDIAILDPLNAQGVASANEQRAKGTDGMNAGREQDMLRQTNTMLQQNVIDQQTSLADMARSQDQLKFSQEGVQAKTMMDSLKEDPNKTLETGKELEGKDGKKTLETGKELEGKDGKKTGQDLTRDPKDPKSQGLPADQNPTLTPEQLRAQTQNQGQMQGQPTGQQQGQTQGLSYLQPQADNLRNIRINPNQPQVQQDPRLVAHMQRTEAKLDAPSQTESKAEGQHLHDRGVRDLGPVPPAQMGQLSPSQSPTVAPQRGVGLG